MDWTYLATDFDLYLVAPLFVLLFWKIATLGLWFLLRYWDLYRIKFISMTSTDESLDMSEFNARFSV